MKQEQAKKQFIDLYNSMSDRLFRYCLVRVSSREQALDIVQDTFLRFWDVMSRTEEVVDKKKVMPRRIQNPRALLFTIIGNLIIDWYRKKKSVSLDALLEPEDEESPFQLSDDSFKEIEINAEAKLVIEKMANLDPIYRQVIYFRFIEDLQPKEIAEIMNLDTNVVSVRINRGIKELQKMVDGSHGQVEK